jgi:hypothetical protein
MAALAVAAQALLLRADAAVDRDLGRTSSAIPARFDFGTYMWPPANALVHGQSAYPFYHGGAQTGIYAPPYVAAAAPFGLLPLDIASLLTTALAAVLMVACLYAWCREQQGGAILAALMALSAPAFAVVRVDELIAVVGLAALIVAVLAQRRERWWITGAALAVALIRPPNAIPVAALLAVSGFGSWRALARMVGGGLVVLIPLFLVAQLWDPTWVGDYLANSALVKFQGPPLLARQAFGPSGPLLISLAMAVVAGAIGRRGRGRPLDLDTAALVMALTVLVSNAGGFYTAIYALPAIARMGMRPGLGAVPWVLTAIPWLIVLVEAPNLLGASPRPTEEMLSLVAFALPLACLPLLRKPRLADRTAPI